MRADVVGDQGVRKDTPRFLFSTGSTRPRPYPSPRLASHPVRSAPLHQRTHDPRKGSAQTLPFPGRSRPYEASMSWSLNIGKVAGTVVRVHLTFLLFLAWIFAASYASGGAATAWDSLRSEERRVGKECRVRWGSCA